jgi:hypothetical protein
LRAELNAKHGSDRAHLHALVPVRAIVRAVPEFPMVNARLTTMPAS